MIVTVEIMCFYWAWHILIVENRTTYNHDRIDTIALPTTELNTKHEYSNATIIEK